MILAGGKYWGGAANVIMDYTYIYDWESKAWTQIGNLKVAINAISCILYRGKTSADDKVKDFHIYKGFIVVQL